MGQYINPASTQDATSCFPVAGGRWTYFNVYSSPAGQKLSSSDEYLETVGGVDVQHSYSPDKESYFLATHTTTSDWSLAQCQGAYNWIVNKLRTLSNVAPAWTVPCAPLSNGSKTLRYDVSYFMSTVHGPRPTIWRSVRRN